MTVLIEIYVRCFPDGYRLHGLRRWPVIPRVGDYVFVNGGRAPWVSQNCYVEKVVYSGGDNNMELEKVQLYVLTEKGTPST